MKVCESKNARHKAAQKDKRVKVWVIDRYEETKIAPSLKRYVWGPKYGVRWTGPDGFRAASDYMAKLQGDEDPGAAAKARKKNRKTVGDAVAAYFAARRKDKTKSLAVATEMEGFFARYVEPCLVDGVPFYDCALDAISTTDLATPGIMLDLQQQIIQVGKNEGHPLASNTAHKIFNHLRLVFAHAVRQKWIVNHPCSRDILPWSYNKKTEARNQRKKASAEISPETWMDLARNWAEYGDLAAEYEPKSEMFLNTMRATGMRPGELLALQSDCSDFKRAVDGGWQVFINKAVENVIELDRDEKKRLRDIGPTKASNKRFVPVTPELVMALKAHAKKKEAVTDLLFGTKGHDNFSRAWSRVQFLYHGWVLTRTGKKKKFYALQRIPSNATPAEIHRMRDKDYAGEREYAHMCGSLAEVIEKTKVPYIPVYNLRHVFLSWCALKGFTEKDMTQMAGHASEEVMRNHYVKALGVLDATDKAERLASR